MKLKSIAGKLALKCHVSTKDAITEIIPLLHIIMKGDQEKTTALSSWLELEDSEVDWLKN